MFIKKEYVNFKNFFFKFGVVILVNNKEDRIINFNNYLVGFKNNALVLSIQKNLLNLFRFVLLFSHLLKSNVKFLFVEVSKLTSQLMLGLGKLTNQNYIINQN